ncbi:hypothetical protein GQ53DRAFT_652198 [Thozetella sp. PMI_491]|nr:hypothetical protein GQ53DRAFT_652198 [Thozetella sp. PMI_491]
MDASWAKDESTRSSEDGDSQDALLTGHPVVKSRRRGGWANWLLAGSLSANVVFALALIVVTTRRPTDLSLGVYSPASHLVEYYTTNITTAFMTKTPYMGFPTNETDQLWEDLYQFGDSFITEEEANRLAYPTINQPGTDNYIIQLEVFHQLHCLNDIRKAFYPERWPKKWPHNKDGSINRNDMQWRHWEHCIDILRGTIMCNADVTPISWRFNVPVGEVLGPHLETTHTCRNFTKIVEWAREHEAVGLRQVLTPEERRELLENPPFDQSAWEDLSEFWPQFPGNKYFKQWQVGWNETSEGRSFWAEWQARKADSIEASPQFVDAHSH